MNRFVIACAFVWLAAGVAEAQSSGSDDRAQLHFHAGNDSYHRGDYESALREFQIALELSGRAELHFNLASCLERLDRDAEAADELERYLAAAPEAPNREALAERVGRLRAHASASSAPPPSDPPPDVIDPDAAPAAVLAETDAAAALAADATAPDAQDGPPHAVGWWVLGAGALGLATFAVLGGLALAEDASLASECGTACAPSRVASLDAYAIGADVSLAVGATLAAVGLVLVLTVREAPASVVTVSASGLGVVF